jgi:photosystem II stability/assembly factor-like uncharacterized protein
MKIKFFLLFLLILSFKNYSQNFWERIDSPTSKNLNSVIFIDSLNGWAAGDSGVIIHTSDGGSSWEIQNQNDSLNIVNMCVLNDHYVIASAVSGQYAPFGSFLLKTTNGGLNWSSEYMRIGEAFINYVYFLDSLTGFAVGYPPFFLRTSDAGATWRQVTLDSSAYAGYSPYAVKFYNQDYGFACGGARDVNGVIWRSRDGGLSWDTVVDSVSAPAEPLYAIHYFDSLNVLVVGGDPEYGASLMRTTDGGDSWVYTSVGILWYPVDVAFRVPSEGWIPLGSKREFLYTSDSGNSWSVILTPDSTYITHLSFPDSIYGFAAGNDGVILRYKYQKPNEIRSLSEKANSFYMAQNYPNPFNPSTSIEYSIPAAGMVQLSVYDVLGREVATLVNEYKPAGRYNIKFSAEGQYSDLSSGIYFIRLKSGSYIQTKKMILLK